MAEVKNEAILKEEVLENVTGGIALGKGRHINLIHWMDKFLEENEKWTGPAPEPADAYQQLLDYARDYNSLEFETAAYNWMMSHPEHDPVRISYNS